MDYKDIDYTKYLSIDNGKGILLSREDVYVLERYGFDFNKYNNLQDLIFDVDNYINDGYGEDDLEYVLQKISEMYYYNNVNK